jgi:chromosome segregation ATPase
MMEEKRCEHKHTMNAELRCKLPAGHMGWHLCAYEHMHNQDDAPDMTPDQRAEYQRYLSSPAGTARALVEARAEIEQLKNDFAQEKMNTDAVYGGVYRALKKEVTARTAAESQIAALKVELAAMMKERDAAKNAARELGKDIARRDGTIAQLMQEAADNSTTMGLLGRNRIDAEKALDAALADLSQARAELDENHDIQCELLKQANDMRDERDAAVKRAEAAEQENETVKSVNGCLRGEIRGLRSDNDRAQALLGRAVSILKSTHWDRAPFPIGVAEQAIDLLADPTATQAADAWRAQREERAELIQKVRTLREWIGAEGQPRVAIELARKLTDEFLAKVDARWAGGKAPAPKCSLLDVPYVDSHSLKQHSYCGSGCVLDPPRAGGKDGGSNG